MGSDLDRALSHVEIAVQNLKQQGIPDGGPGLDAAGRMLSCVTALNNMIDAIVAETPEETRGDNWEIGHAAARTDRTFNTPALLTAAQEALGRSRQDTIADLLDHAVLDLKWNWRPLVRYANDLGIPLRVVKGEPVKDSDLGPHVGEVRKEGRARLVPRHD